MTNPSLDDDLRRLVDAWPALADPVRAGIAAMVRAAVGDLDERAT